MGPVYYSIKSRKKVVHLSHCGYIRRIARNNLRSFKSLEEAEKHGYRLCNCCPSIAHKYRKEKKQIDEFCKTKGFTAELYNGAVHIISALDRWQVIINGRNKSMFLYHKNTDTRFHPEKYPSSIPGYHSQCARSDTILGYLNYIDEHDDYRSKHPLKEYPYGRNDKKSSNKSDLTAEKRKKKSKPADKKTFTKIKGTKKYRKEQKKLKSIKRRAEITRVFALFDELAAARV